MQDVKEVAGVDDRCRARHDHGFFVRGGRDGLHQIYNALAHEPQYERRLGVSPVDLYTILFYKTLASVAEQRRSRPKPKSLGTTPSFKA